MVQPSTRSSSCLVFEAPDEVRVRSVEVPATGPGELLVRTSCSALSNGTERWVLRNRFTWAPTPYPCIPGYQRVGEVVDVGAEVEGWAVGDRAFIGFAGRVLATGDGPLPYWWGAHQELALVSTHEALPVPPGLCDEDAAGALTTQVGFNAAARLSPVEGVILVWGDGLVGQTAAQSAAARGFATLLIGHHPARLGLAGRRGIPTVSSRDPNWREELSRHLAGRPVDAVIDTVQSQASQADYLPLLAGTPGRQVVFAGFTPGDGWMLDGELQKLELTVHLVSGATRDRLLSTLDALSDGRLSFRALVTDEIAPSDAPSLYRDLTRSNEGHLGVLIRWR